MNTQTKEKTCSERVSDALYSRLDDLETAQEYFETIEAYEEPSKELKEKAEALGLESIEDFYQFLGEYGLCWFDWVEPNTSYNEGEGYYRWQLSYGGPSEEFRIYIKECDSSYFCNGRRYSMNSIKKIEFWFLDWYDGACKITKNEVLTHIVEMFLDSIEAKPQYEIEGYSEGY